MLIVFIAGPYRSPTEWGLIQNIRAAEDAALQVWGLGAAAMCPHKNTAHFGGAADDSVWLEGAKAMLLKSDAVLALPEWQKSEGATGEVALASQNDIPVFESIEDLRAWVTSQA